VTFWLRNGRVFLTDVAIKRPFPASNLFSFEPPSDDGPVGFGPEDRAPDAASLPRGQMNATPTPTDAVQVSVAMKAAASGSVCGQNFHLDPLRLHCEMKHRF